MRAMSEDDLSHIVQGFALAAIDPSQWLIAISQVSDAAGAVCSALEFADLSTGEASMECSFRMEGSVLRDYEERIFHINPRVRHAMPLQVGRIAGDLELGWGDDTHAPEFRDWLQEVPYYYMQGVKILQTDSQVGFFSTHFSRQHGPAGSEHEKLHRAIAPHLINMSEVGRALSANKLRNELVTHYALEGDKPFALLDRAGCIVECSRGFEVALRDGDVIGLRGRQLVGRHHQHRRLIERFLASALGERRFVDPPLPIRLVGPSNAHGIVLRAAPLPRREDIFDIFRPAALVTLTDLDAPMKAQRRELSALFSLTNREADVAALIAEGNSIERTAAALSISQYTVKQHLKAVFGKMAIERQSDLVAIVTRLS